MALEGALNLGPGGADRLGVAVATLGLLAHTAEERPLLLAVDDAHSLDLPTLEALVFSVRRMRAEPIAVLVTARSPADASPAVERWLGALPELAVGGLDLGAARRLLGPSTPLSRATWEATAGNPLALLELPVAGVSPLPVEPVRLARGWCAPTSGACRACRRRPAARCCWSPSQAAPTTPSPKRWPSRISGSAISNRPRQPTSSGATTATTGLVAPACTSATRSSAARSTTRPRRAGNARHTGRSPRCTAAAAGPGAAERRAFHLAAAAPGTDEDVAAQLTAAARGAAARNNHVTALALLERAARLSPSVRPVSAGCWRRR